MTEFHIIGTGNIYEFVIKDIDNPRTYGRFGACGDDRKSMQEFIDYVNEIIEENQALKQSDNITDLETQIMKLKEENENLKQALWEAEEEYLHEAYHDNPIRLQDKIINLKEDWDKEYWND